MISREPGLQVYAILQAWEGYTGFDGCSFYSTNVITILSKLISSQVSVSDDERARIMKEHEKQMVKLENR